MKLCNCPFNKICNEKLQEKEQWLRSGNIRRVENEDCNYHHIYKVDIKNGFRNELGELI